MRKTLPILTTTALAAPLLCAALAGNAYAGPFDNVAQIDVLPGWQTQNGTHMAGVRITLQPGWKTYWRTPGDAGIPPQFSWAGSENIATAQYHWPTPEVMDQNNMQAIGYHDSLVLPIELSPTQAGQPITMSGEVLIGVCEDICIPVTLPFSAELPIDGRRDGAITASLLNQPLSASDAGVSDAICAIEPSGQGLQVTATVTMPTSGQNETVVIETGNPQVWVSQSDVIRQGDQLQATVDMIHVSSSSFALDRSDVRITVLGGDYAVDVRGCTGG